MELYCNDKAMTFGRQGGLRCTRLSNLIDMAAPPWAKVGQDPSLFVYFHQVTENPSSRPKFGL